MLQAFLGNFLLVLLMMTLVFHSALWGIISMIPLTVSIALIYGVIGIIGKDYDMPVAVLSSLSLGLAVDYAIHFLSRSRKFYEKYGSWSASAGPVFGEPARAISRNAIVVGIGFLPLILTPLVPYQTVGILISSIIFTAGIASLIILPSMITLLEPLLFPKTKICCFVCHCTTFIITIITAVAAPAINIHQFLSVGWTSLTWLSIVLILILGSTCAFIKRSKKCKV